MINLMLDLLRLVYNFVPLLFAIAVFTGLALLLSRSIKKHAVVWYWVLAIPFLLTIIPFLLGFAGVKGPEFRGVPVLSYFVRDYVHMATLGFPLLVIIMYMGALDTRCRWVARLMSIRQQLSIIVGFPVLTHGLLRAFNTFPNGLKFFFAHDDYLAERPVASVTGAAISNFVFVLGIFMLVLFFILWITSFTAVRRRMGGLRWKRVQRWAYVLYAMLFIHSMGLQIGGLITAAAEGEQKPPVEARAPQGAPGPQDRMPSPRAGREEGRRDNPRDDKYREGKGRDEKGRDKKSSLADIKPDRNTKRYIHICEVVLVFGSYLWLRVRKARRRKA